MSSPNPTSKEQRRHDIFRAASAKFVGGTVQANDRISIKTIISQNPTIFESVVNMYGSDMVVQIISSLIDNGTLTSKQNVQLASHMPQHLSGVRDRQHVALEQEAAHSEAKALGEASKSDLAIHEHDQGDEQIDFAEAGPIETSSTAISSKSPSLFPAYLLYSTQHKLLNTVQRILEDCCYEWANQWIPSLLEEQGWSCSEAVELGTWTATIPQRFDAFSFDTTTLGSGQALTAAFEATHPLRHAAVHRLRTSVKGIERMLKNAVNLVTALQDTERRCKLQHILTDFRNTMQAMEVDKIDLENQLDEELHNIQEQRGALDRKEQEARLSMVQRDPESTARISSLFETSISNLTSMDEFSATSTEQDNARSSELGEVCDEAVAGGTPDKHSGGGIYHTIDEACCENTDSKPGKHGDSDPSALQDIPDDHDADENHIGTMDAGCEDSDSKPSD